MLRQKHPAPIVPDVEVLDHYNVVPEFVPIDITEDTVEQISGQLTGAAGLGGINAAGLQQWLLRFGVASHCLRRAVALLTYWIANNFLPWAATRALLDNWLMALDKCPGICPIGIGEIWRRILAKCVLKVDGANAKDACGNTQMCANLEAGIEGAVHAAQALFAKKEDQEEWGFLLIDTANTFNASNHIACLWTVRHRWPSGARFSLNCHRH